MPDYAALLSAATHAVADACLVCRTVQQDMDRLRAIVKDDNSPVTVADFASQAVVANMLMAQTGACILVGEETSAYLRNPEHAVQLAATLAAAQEVWGDADEKALIDAIDMGASNPDPAGFWTLDPIDGTKGFVRGQQYAVSLAYIERGEPVIGVLGCPNLSRDFSVPFDEIDDQGCIYTCIRGQGVYELPADDPGAKPIKIQRLLHRNSDAISVCSSVEESHTSSERIAAVLATAAAKGVKFREPSRLDSQCKYAVVARAQADVYLRMPSKKLYLEKIWDHAAGSLVAQEAGCTVTDVRGNPLDFSRGTELTENRGIVVAPPTLHSRVIDTIARLGLAPTT